MSFCGRENGAVFGGSRKKLLDIRRRDMRIRACGERLSVSETIKGVRCRSRGKGCRERFFTDGPSRVVMCRVGSMSNRLLGFSLFLAEGSGQSKHNSSFYSNARILSNGGVHLCKGRNKSRKVTFRLLMRMGAGGNGVSQVKDRLLMRSTGRTALFVATEASFQDRRPLR